MKPLPPWIPVFLATALVAGHYTFWTLAMHRQADAVAAAENEVKALQAQAGPVLLLEKRRREAADFLDLVARYDAQAHDPVSYAQWSDNIPASLRPADVTRTGDITVIEGHVPGDTSSDLDALVAHVGALDAFGDPQVEKTTRHFYVTLSPPEGKQP